MDLQAHRDQHKVKRDAKVSRTKGLKSENAFFFFSRFLTIKERSPKVDSGGPCCPMPRVFMLPSYKTNPLRRGSAWLCWWDHSLHADPIWWDQSCRAESGSTAHPHSLSCRLQETAAPHSGRRQGMVSIVCLHLLASITPSDAQRSWEDLQSPRFPANVLSRPCCSAVGMRCSSLREPWSPLTKLLDKSIRFYSPNLAPTLYSPAD